ncbi:ATP-binding cassette domain-containing protein [Pseudooceanicola algae]|uniref:Thiamine import ATP-binding protein ThiQ n=1 Tax=Pseudooceanicola algae TaxID=1537215 RepID=A0A418SBM6_9RHOB|nr:ATP-binding cassette domain-containing protein [Pseudooceanicola algae]QPM92470.1 Thiamine import ATP-binding protein ThiQ [Pseudooceanicola algae]
MTLEIDALSIRFRGNPPLFATLSLTIGPGQICTVMGPSGVGKSTLLDAIGGHLAHGFTASGSVVLNGRPLDGIAPEKRRIGLLFQDTVLFPHLSVGDNLAFGLDPRLRGRRARREAVDQALEAAGLAGMAARDPATLSGGQRARVALMRTLLAEPLALLLDEPFSKLDAALRAEMRAFTFDHLRDRAIPALMVTHDPQDAEAAGGPVIHMGPAT